MIRRALAFGALVAACSPAPPEGILVDPGDVQTEQLLLIHMPSVEIDFTPWPPLGPDVSLDVHVSDPQGDLSECVVTFGPNAIQRSVTGAQATVTFTAGELGAGLGPLSATAVDARGRSATESVESVLVDLGSPRLTWVSDVVSTLPGSTISFVVEDDWVLDRVTVTMGDWSHEIDFPDELPDTLGVAWDSKTVTFSVGELPEAAAEMTVVVSDAAGNSVTETRSVVVDATAPVASISEPLAGAVLAGAFVVAASGVDTLGPVVLELSVGGTWVASATGPEATFEVDASTFAAGPTQVSIVAIDPAGNESEPAVVDVTLS